MKTQRDHCCQAQTGNYWETPNKRKGFKGKRNSVAIRFKLSKNVISWSGGIRMTFRLFLLEPQKTEVHKFGCRNRTWFRNNPSILTGPPKPPTVHTSNSPSPCLLEQCWLLHLNKRETRKEVRAWFSQRKPTNWLNTHPGVGTSGGGGVSRRSNRAGPIMSRRRRRTKTKLTYQSEPTL